MEAYYFMALCREISKENYFKLSYIEFMIFSKYLLRYSNLPNNQVGPLNHVGGRFLRN